MIRNFIRRKIGKDIRDKIRLIEEYNKELYELNNNLRSKFYESSNIKEFNDITIKDYYRDELFLNGINKEEYRIFINNKNKLSKELAEKIDKFNSYIPNINKYYLKINQYERTLKSVREFLAEEINKNLNENDYTYIVKFGFDKSQKLLCMMYKLSDSVVLITRKPEVLQVFWGNENGSPNKIVIRFTVYKDTLEINTIETYSNELRKGRGRFAIECIEKVIIPLINKKREENADKEIGYYKRKIRLIYGHMGELGKINSIERRQFYISCGYKFREYENTFYKNITI